MSSTALAEICESRYWYSLSELRAFDERSHTSGKGLGLSVPPKIAVGPSRDICCANALPGDGRCHGVLERAGQGVFQAQSTNGVGCIR